MLCRQFYLNHPLKSMFDPFTNKFQFNWSGTVRVPALCQYAHKLAFLASQSMQAAPQGQMARRIERTLYFL